MSGIDSPDRQPAPSAVIAARVRLAWRSPRDGEVAGIPHPRAASGLARVMRPEGMRLALVQDDAASLALVDPVTGFADAIALPNPDGQRFDAPFGEKKNKPDLECCVVVPRGDGEVIVAFGSGSTGLRERVALVDPVTLGAALVPAHGLYAALRAAPGFAGGAMNIEGAVVDGDRLWLFQRGNGGAFPALASVAVTAFWQHLGGGAAPVVDDVRKVDLGAIAGVALGFTDAAWWDGRIWWLGSAESSPNTYDDGAVAGSAIGILDGPAATICTDDGACFLGKAEGLALVGGGRAWVAVDPDDPEVAAELLDVRLSGFG